MIKWDKLIFWYPENVLRTKRIIFFFGGGQEGLNGEEKETL